MHTPPTSHTTHAPISGLIHQHAQPGTVAQPPRESLAYASPHVMVIQPPAPRRSSGELAAIAAVVGLVGLFSMVAFFALLAVLALVAAVAGLGAIAFAAVAIATRR